MTCYIHVRTFKDNIVQFCCMSPSPPTLPECQESVRTCILVACSMHATTHYPALSTPHFRALFWHHKTISCVILNLHCQSTFDGSFILYTALCFFIYMYMYVLVMSSLCLCSLLICTSTQFYIHTCTCMHMHSQRHKHMVWLKEYHKQILQSSGLSLWTQIRHALGPLHYCYLFVHVLCVHSCTCTCTYTWTYVHVHVYMYVVVILVLTSSLWHASERLH